MPEDIALSENWKIKVKMKIYSSYTYVVVPEDESKETRRF